MSDLPQPSSSAGPRDAWVLARYRLIQLRNTVDQQLRDAPIRTFIVIVLLVIIWIALYLLLSKVFEQVSRWELVAIVANKQIFVHFFLVLAIMLAISNAVLAFGSLFGRTEAAHLLGMPAHPRQVLCVKWVEGMLLSSWSFLLLGVPLMLAVANNKAVEWYFYPLFIGHFIGFVLIPSTFGLILAWGIAMWVPRRPLVLMLWVTSVIVLAFVGYVWQLTAQAGQEEWLQLLFREMSLAKNKFFPSTWSAEGIVAAMERRVADSLVYFLVVLGNACFFTWLTINVLGGTWAEAYNRARRGRGRSDLRRGWLTSGVCFALFFYLSKRLRMIVLKDFRAFARDPTQWTQMVIMLGLLVVYALNLRRLPLDFDDPRVKALTAFLNLTTISLILATFTSRFVYPLLSLETQQLWLLGLLPTSRTRILLVKFLFALTITALSGVGVMALAVSMLELPIQWGYFNLLLCFGVCVGLSGLAVGIGARFPVLGQRNPARIAAGFGGTVNLIASMVLVSGNMVSVALVGLREMRISGSARVLTSELSPETWQIGVALAAASVLIAIVTLVVGARHFERLEH